MKIAVSGSHGTGKSTLLDRARGTSALAGVSLVEEVPRALCERVGDPLFLQRGRNSVTRQLLLIAAQIAEEARAIGSPIVVSDRSVVDHWAYTLAVLEPADAGQPEAQEARRLVEMWAGTYDQIFFLPIEFPLAVDDVREDDIAFQHRIDTLIRAEYDRLSLGIVELSGSIDERLSEFLDSIMTIQEQMR